MDDIEATRAAVSQAGGNGRTLEAGVRSAGGRCNASSGLIARVSGRKRPDARLGLRTGVKVRTPPVTVRGLTP